MQNVYHVLGFSRDVTACGCCSKSCPNGTYVIECEGSVQYLGPVCAFKQTGKSQKMLYQASLKATLQADRDVENERKQRVNPLEKQINTLMEEEHKSEERKHLRAKILEVQLEIAKKYPYSHWSKNYLKFNN